MHRYWSGGPRAGAEVAPLELGPEMWFTKYRNNGFNKNIIRMTDRSSFLHVTLI